MRRTLSGSKRKSETDLLRLQLADTHFQSDVDKIDAHEERRRRRRGGELRSPRCDDANNLEWEHMTALARTAEVDAERALGASITSGCDAPRRISHTSDDIKEAPLLVVGSPPEYNQRNSGVELLEASYVARRRLLDHHDDDDDAGRTAKAPTPRVTFDQLPAGAKDVAKSKDDGLFELEL